MSRLILSIVIFGAFCISALAQTTTFTYQGKLSDTGSPTTNYDFEFRLWDALTGGNLLATQAHANVPVTNGLFSVKVDLGSSFSSGAPRYLEIAVKNVGAGSFTILSPRQQITSAPYNIRSLSAANADQLGGISASGFIQNTSSQQPANFNISGNGIIGGYTKLGSDAPSIKVKKLTGTTAATEGGIVTIFHGLDGSKILSISIMVNYIPTHWVGPDTNLNGLRFTWVEGGGAVSITNIFGGSASILSKPIKILITYEQ